MKTRLCLATAFLGSFIFATGNIGAQQYYYHPQYGWYYYPDQQQQQPPQTTPSPRKHNLPEEPRKPKQKIPPVESTPQARTVAPSSESKTDFAPVETTGEIGTYVWSDSENFGKLAKACGLSTKELLDFNKITFSELRSGQILKVPVTNDPYLTEKMQPGYQNSREIWRGVRGKKRVALTFDAGADAKHADELLKNLTENKIPASFFITGDFAKKNRDMMKKISDAGYRIYNHSWSHPEFTKTSDEQMKSEMKRTDELLTEITGDSTKPYWRPPFGDRDRRVLQVVGNAGYRSIYWTVDSLDSVGEPKDEGFIVDRVMNFKLAKGNIDHYLDGGIILMHLGKSGTAKVIPRLAKELRSKGFTLVTVDEIVKP